MPDRDLLRVRSCKSVKSRMRLIRDEQAYFRIVDDFVARRVSAAVFIPRFQHLWRGDGADRTRHVGISLGGLAEGVFSTGIVGKTLPLAV